MFNEFELEIFFLIIYIAASYFTMGYMFQTLSFITAVGILLQNNWSSNTRDDRLNIVNFENLKLKNIE